MGTDTKILLPLHVSSDKIGQVIARLMDAPTRQESFDKHLSGGTREKILFDPSQPGSDDNPWHTRIEKGSFELSSIQGVEYGYLSFKTPTQQMRQWILFQETEHEDGKLLNPRSSALAIAIGTRLVRFFGGQIQYQDSHDEIDLVVPNNQALFPRRRRAQQGNDRWYQFHNLLWNTPPLTALEIKQASKLAAYPLTEEDHSLLVELEKRELERAVPQGHEQKKLRM